MKCEACNGTGLKSHREVCGACKGLGHDGKLSTSQDSIVVWADPVTHRLLTSTVEKVRKIRKKISKKK